jgi:hypothetical protein
MTLTFTGDDPTAGVTLSQAMELYRDVANEVFAAIRRIKNGEWDPKGATHVVKEMRAFFELVLEERSRVEKQRRADEGAVNGYALDFEAARDEIGRRLACLRDAGGG